MCIIFIILPCWPHLSCIGHLIGACFYCKSNATWADWWASDHDAGAWLGDRDTVSGHPLLYRPGAPAGGGEGGAGGGGAPEMGRAGARVLDSAVKFGYTKTEGADVNAERQ